YRVLCALYAAPRALHSFPTRRSSDLLLAAGAVQVEVPLDRVLPPAQPAQLAPIEAADGPLDVLVRLGEVEGGGARHQLAQLRERDRKSTRLNSSQVKSSYAVFCLKKK